MWNCQSRGSGFDSVRLHLSSAWTRWCWVLASWRTFEHPSTKIWNVGTKYNHQSSRLWTISRQAPLHWEVRAELEIFFLSRQLITDAKNKNNMKKERCSEQYSRPFEIESNFRSILCTIRMKEFQWITRMKEFYWIPPSLPLAFAAFCVQSSSHLKN